MSGENTQLNLEELVKNIVDRAIDKINDVVDSEYKFKLYRVDVNRTCENYVDVSVNVGYVIKLLEISESVSEGFNWYINDLEKELGRELTEEEVEEEWNRIYNDELEELNGEYAFYVNVELRKSLYDIYPFYSGELRIIVNPLECDGDYCDVGADIEIEFKDIRVETIEKASDIVEAYLTTLFELIREIITQ
jgi:hypothetical protein